MTEGEVKARKILRDPETKKVTHSIFRYKGHTYRIVEGRCLEEKEYAAFDEEQRKKGVS